MREVPPSTVDGLYAAAFTGRDAPGVVHMPYGSQTALVRLGRAIDLPARKELHAIDNANQRYRLWLIYEARARLPDAAVLVVSGAAVALASVGRDSEKTFYELEVERGVADAIALRFAVPRSDRSPIGESVTGRFRALPQVARAGEPIEIELVLENPAAAPAVQVQVGGRQRGPRDNRFELIVHRDGERLAELPGQDFGGPTFFTEIAPGGALTIRERVDRWADVRRPGHYRAECRYTTTLAEVGVDPWSAGNRARVWDRTFCGELEFDVEG